jgi:uncharacterized repeat protein (TIGR01451 family)
MSLAMLPVPTLTHAKSLYVIANINARPTPVQTYDIQGAPSYLVFQAEAGVPRFAGGAVGIAVDNDSATLFVTYENSNIIQLLDATNFADLGTTAAPGASNLAGIVADQRSRKVYAVDRETSKLYVYSWDANTNTLTLDGGASKVLQNVTRANGLALDETRSRLYVGDRDTTLVRYYNTNSFGAASIPEAGSVDLSAEGQTVQGVAIDSVRNILYTGNSYGPYGSLGKLVKADLENGTVTAYTLPGATGGDNIVGIAVDEDRGFVYASTGNQGSGGTDTLIVFDEGLNVLKNDIGSIGNPTGIAIPREDISYNPLNFSKTDNPDPVSPGGRLTYTLCYDNLPNTNPVTNVTVVDSLANEVTFDAADAPCAYSSATRAVTCNEGLVPAGAPQVCRDINVNVNAAAGSTFLNQATIESDQTPPTTKTVDTTVASGPVGPPTAVPTLSQWTMILLAGFLALGGVAALRLRR